jgi:serine/threonine protein kinase
VSGSAGRQLGSFVVEGELGRGGMGEVFLARQPGLHRPAVLKRLRRDLAEDPELAERFAREARAAAGVHHQNVVAVYDRFAYRGELYIAQEYIDGTDLRGLLERKSPLPWRIAGRIALEMLRGLEAIHSAGTVHRDLKPANLLIGRRGEVKIADFGIALEATGSGLTQPGILIGTPPYMPPEQLMGERLDARGDLFSFGVVLYEMLAGATPYPAGGDDASESLLRRMQRERYAPLRRRGVRCPRFLARIVRQCLRARPRQRPPSAARLRRLLEAKLSDASPPDSRAVLAAWLWENGVFEVRPDETVLRVPAPRRPPHRRRLAVGVAAATVLLGLVLLAVHGGIGGAASPLPPLPSLSRWVARLAATGGGQDTPAAERTASSDRKEATSPRHR